MSAKSQQQTFRHSFDYGRLVRTGRWRTYCDRRARPERDPEGRL